LEFLSRPIWLLKRAEFRIEQDTWVLQRNVLQIIKENNKIVLEPVFGKKVGRLEKSGLQPIFSHKLLTKLDRLPAEIA
jgi:hypothetical protein